MSLSIILQPIRSSGSSQTRRKVLVTGAAGRIGSYFAAHNQKHDLRLLVHDSSDDNRWLADFGELVVGDLGDAKRLAEVCHGIDVVLHLAGEPNPSASWDSVLQANVIGTYNLYAAAKKAGCRKVIYASSIHAVSGYENDVQVKESDPVNPGDIYGVSKCFGEALARYMAVQEDLPSVVLRIGAFQPIDQASKPGNIPMLDAFLSERDFQQMAEKCIDDETLRFAIFHCLSNNKFKRLDISNARDFLGYQPEDDFIEENPNLRSLADTALQKHSLKDEGQESGMKESLS